LERFAALVPAAGRGERFGGSLPKQFVPIAGQPVLSWTVARLLQAGAARVVVALPPDRLTWGRDAWREEPRVETVAGGATRQESVARCLAALGPGAPEWVLVHDGARPAVAIEDVRNALAAAQRDGWEGAVLGRSVADTMKRVDSGGAILDTADRERLFHAETPQVFRRPILAQALERAAREGFVGTDESSLVERIGGLRIAAVPARFPNPKLTAAGDLGLLERLLGADRA
jgi:2-C-methyl-D-erythritol 4-phosphate cytidylyltransferase